MTSVEGPRIQRCRQGPQSGRRDPRQGRGKSWWDRGWGQQLQQLHSKPETEGARVGGAGVLAQMDPVQIPLLGACCPTSGNSNIANSMLDPNRTYTSSPKCFACLA